MADAGSNLQALKNYVQAVKQREYPAAEHSF
jgi:ketopantoate hydroxymethyltransferase